MKKVNLINELKNIDNEYQELCFKLLEKIEKENSIESIVYDIDNYLDKNIINK
ncbi:hypothetical protein OF820_06225 [Oceanotoga sp. DSM 15011]|uniref:hypothetical protein n=1 Tax=Oceanotoga sp. DSM 15011 TaxID=2984951 RepID=UPI0021F4D200|nr:hypothetical protein [Oceanotoga sp. DSM 15011]UYP01281.1 hypothetical protein OF820_06225 [Oceanotoga sp. DSM 15011]